MEIIALWAAFLFHLEATSEYLPYFMLRFKVDEVWIKGCNLQFRSGLDEFAFLIINCTQLVSAEVANPYLNSGLPRPLKH